MELDDLFTDADLEVGGTWVDAGDYDPTLAGLELKVARMLNPAFTRLFDELRRVAGPEQDNDEDTQFEIMLKCTAKCLLRGWRNLTIDGTAVKFSDAKCLDYLAKSIDLRNVVTRISRDRQVFKSKQSEADRKN